MAKLIKKAELNKIVKAYNLTTAEASELEDYTSTLNTEYADKSEEVWYCSETRFRLFSTCGYIPEKQQRNAIVACILYLAKRIQDMKKAANEVGAKVYSLKETCWELALMLHVSSYELKGFFIGLYTDHRFNQYVHEAHTFGQDYLEIN